MIDSNFDHSASDVEQTPQKIRLTFRSGGWVILIAGLICMALIAIAVWPVIANFGKPKPAGDNENIESYGFVLEPCLVNRDYIKPAMMHRDMVIVMREPSTVPGADVERINEEERGKFLVPSDQVIGVEIDGEARAYPIYIINVHDIVNDELGGVPIAVTYNWLCDSVMVFDRRVGDETLTFGESGLVYNSNVLIYDRRTSWDEIAVSPEESLWVQMSGRAVTGPAAVRGETLRTIPYTLTSWQRWLAAHPDTTVLERDPQFVKRYKHAIPTPYFQSKKIVFPIEPPHDVAPAIASSPDIKEPTLFVRVNDSEPRLYPLSALASRSDVNGRWTDMVGDVTLHFQYDLASHTATVTAEPDSAKLEVRTALWFAWQTLWDEVTR